MNRFFFLHIPKTAGMSIHRFLDKSAGPYLHLRHPHEQHWPAARIWSHFRGCGGHASWPIANRTGLLDAFTLTFLRDPIERVLSQYEFARLPELGGRPDSIVARKSTLAELIHPIGSYHESFSNAQTLALSGLTHDTARPEEHLASALEHLARLDFIGTTETIAADCAELCRLLGSAAPVSIPHENQNRRRLLCEELSADMTAMLNETQALDLALYARALELRSSRNAQPLDREDATLVGWPPSPQRTGTREAQIGDVKIRPNSSDELRPGQEAELSIQLVCGQPLNGVTLGIRIEDILGNYIAGTNSFVLTKQGLNIPIGTSTGVFRFPITMGAGRYSVTVGLHRGSRKISWIESAAIFEVQPPLSPYREGMVDITPKLTVAHDTITGPLSEEEARLVIVGLEGSPLIELTSGEIRIPIRITNGSKRIISSDDNTRVFASYHWVQLDGSTRLHDGIRTALPQPIWAGEDACFHIRVLPPPSVGTWRLQTRLVQEGIRWHEGPDFEAAMPPDIRIEYRQDRSIALLKNQSIPA